jgi:hypothetical protein
VGQWSSSGTSDRRSLAIFQTTIMVMTCRCIGCFSSGSGGGSSSMCACMCACVHTCRGYRGDVQHCNVPGCDSGVG